MIDSVFSGKVRTQCRGRVMRREGGAFHVLHYQGSRETTGMWRSVQQEQAIGQALRVVAEEGASSVEAFSGLAIGDNPLVQLNVMKGQNKLTRGPDFTERQVDGGWEVTVSVLIPGEEAPIEMTATREAKNGKNGAKMAAATSLVQALMNMTAGPRGA